MVINVDKNKVFALIGGDRRTLYLKEFLENNGNKVLLTGFENREECSPLSAAVNEADVLFLPVPAADKEGNIPCAFGNPIPLTEFFSLNLKGKRIFCGKKNLLFPFADGEDYSEHPFFGPLNALPTAEGALMIAIQNSDRVLCGSSCLVVGFGHIGKVLSKSLSLLGAKVTVSARKASDIAQIESMGLRAIKTHEIHEEAASFDFVFNTVPAPVIGESFLRSFPKNSLIIELASLPGGVDPSALKLYSPKIVCALGLPGKTAPKTAAQILYQILETILEG